MRPALFVSRATWVEYHRRRRRLWRMPAWQDRAAEMRELRAWAAQQRPTGNWLIAGLTPNDERLLALTRAMEAA